MIRDTFDQFQHLRIQGNQMIILTGDKVGKNCFQDGILMFRIWVRLVLDFDHEMHLVPESFDHLL